jgi:hypothetical protein
MKLLLLLVIGLVFFIIGYKFLSSKDGSGSRKNLLLGVASLLLLILGYSMLQDKGESKNLEILLSFNQDKTIVCRDIKVNNAEFNYVSGTLSFVAKDSSQHKGLTLPIEECKIPQTKSEKH